MDGILLVDKPKGWTSHDVVAKARGIIKAESGQKIKIGHTGTLDPFATGLLVLVLGSYTKRAGEFSKLDKTYEAELTLGATSTTGDREGKMSRLKTVDGKPGKDEIETVLMEFTGKIQQKPHIYSAVKVGGQRAYKLAQKGQKIELEPREVTVYSLRSTFYQYPKLCITVKVSSGTYIRSLAENIGQKLRTGAYLSALRRTEVGSFFVNEAIGIDKLSFGLIEQHLSQALPKE
ncbi:tRNA pseudouridine(55) synthase TruB [Candidatus Saccharibacteria bacterium]|nr:tRNA pseudouridine(55) synthase TruB [Candidatus Saccharibacteria bacterium]